jgi:hypothetical protein
VQAGQTFTSVAGRSSTPPKPLNVESRSQFHGSDVFEFEVPFAFTAKRKFESATLWSAVTPSELIAS